MSEYLASWRWLSTTTDPRAQAIIKNITPEVFVLDLWLTPLEAHFFLLTCDSE